MPTKDTRIIPEKFPRSKASKRIVGERGLFTVTKEGPQAASCSTGFSLCPFALALIGAGRPGFSIWFCGCPMLALWAWGFS